jgi:hypothetical protein
VDLAQRDVFVGRLVRFRDLSFFRVHRAPFRQRVVATHFFRPAQLAAALPGAPLTVSDMAGERVTLSASDKLSIDLVRPGEFEVELPRERFADPAKAREAIESRGGRVLDLHPATPDGPVALTVQFAAEQRDAGSPPSAISTAEFVSDPPAPPSRPP